jgi:hypothetical protein
LAPLLLSAPISADGSALCEGLVERFIGLPASSGAVPRPAPATPPMAGRWWIRSCSAKAVSDELRIRLDGPGWYWVDESHNGLSLRQQVPFNLHVEFDGKVHERSAPGVFSLWLEPAREPRVKLTLTAKLELHGRGAWGSFLRAVLPVQAMVSKRFSESSATALRDGLRGGATLTYVIRSGQADAVVGKLPQGQTARHPFQDDSAWLVNDRLLLAPGATHVVGPLEPGPSSLDVTIERGSGLSYRAICAESMADQYAAIASGRVERIAEQALAASGNIVGSGPHETTLRVERCKYYLVLWALEKRTTLAALRVRA